MSRAKAFWISCRRQGLFPLAFFCLLFYRALIMFRAVAKLEGGLTTVTGNGQGREGDWARIRRIANVVRACDAFVPGSTCLVRALATKRLLSLFGLQASLRIGVGRDEQNKFVAHAWVEANGKIVIGESGDFDRYSPMVTSTT